MKKKYSLFRPMILSKNHSCNELRAKNKTLPLMKVRSVVRLGSITEVEDTIANGGSRVEINTTQSIKNSSNKRIMKEKFTEFEVNTATWDRLDKVLIDYTSNETGVAISDQDIDGYYYISFPVVIKSNYGSKGKGNNLIKSKEELVAFINDKNLNSFIIEKFMNFSKEYRLHVTQDECFYTCRKMLKSEFKDLPGAWQRHDNNCSWILEENELFDKPTNWNDVVEHCIKAIKSVGLDVGACDLKIQSNYDKNGNLREYPEFIVLEVNSAPSFGQITLEKYKEIIPKLINKKVNNN